MKFVHSFWSKPLLNNKFDKYQELLPVILSNYAYSVACIKAHGHSIRLFADEKGAELLSFIPYSEIVIVDELDDQSVHFAAQIKFDALYNMDLDEILIDGDLFIRQPAAFKKLESLKLDFVYSFYEPNSFILSSDLQKQRCNNLLNVLKKHQDKFVTPYELDKTINEFHWPNTSLMKFNNEQLKNQYIEQYTYHQMLLENEEFDTAWPDIIIEQRHMDKLLEYGKYTSSPMIENYPTPEANEYAIKIGYTHLGSCKIQFKDLIFSWLKQLNPELYRKTLRQIDKYKTPPC